MISLAQKLRKNRFWYIQVYLEGKVCIYEQGVLEDLKYYEVFIVKIKPVRVFKGKQIPEREVFPCNEDFGKTAWSCRTLQEAMNRYKKLIEKNSKIINIK